MKKLFLMAACAVFALTASAQRASSSSSSFFSTEKVDGGVQWGIRAGLNFANASWKYEEDGESESGSYDSRTAFHVGVIADIPLMQSLYIQTGLFLTSKGCKNEEGDEYYKYEEKASPLYLEIPILASYRYNFSDAAQLQVNFGPYFAYGISGKYKETETSSYYDESESYEEDFFGDGDDEAGFKRFDMGLQVGAGVTIAKHYYIGFAYQFGLVNTSYDDDDTVKNKNWMVSVGYNF